MTAETALKNKIKIALSKRGYIPIPMIRGRFFTADGRPINTGLPSGCSDILFIQPETGRCVWIETKIHPRKPTAEQERFIHIMQQQGCIAGVCYTVNDAIKIVE